MKKKINVIAIALILFYQRFISTLTQPSCRYVPSCSEYSKQAFSKYHFRKAFKLTVKRILRCHPFSASGYDPLP